MNRHMILGVAAVAALTLVGCAGSGGSGSSDSTWNPRGIADIPIPGFTADGDLVNVDLAIVYGGRYYFTDRSNGSVDVIDIATNTLIKQIKGEGENAFSGCRSAANARVPCGPSASNAKSGPNGINAITGTTKIYVPDVDNVRVIDTTSLTVTKTIKLLNLTGTRADEGCFDADHKIYMISSNASPIKYATFINTQTDTAFATVLWTGGPFDKADGNEQCQYDPGTQSFLVNNDGTKDNPHGEVDVIPVASLLALAPGSTVNIGNINGLKRWPLPHCSPSGMDLGPGTDMIVECRPDEKGQLLTTFIMNRTNGAILATLNAGGADQVNYDPATNRYYLAAARWKSSGIATAGGACTAADPCHPVVHIIDAATRTVVTRVPLGNAGKSGVVDPVTGRLYVPYGATTKPANSIVSPQFHGSANGGVAVYSTR